MNSAANRGQKELSTCTMAFIHLRIAARVVVTLLIVAGIGLGLYLGVLLTPHWVYALHKGSDLAACQQIKPGMTLNDVLAAVQSGPNAGYLYFGHPVSPDLSKYYFHIEINPDLIDDNSDYYLQQCGDYPGNPDGFMSGAQELYQTRRHEYTGVVQSHYAFLLTTFIAHDIEQYFEKQVLAPGRDANTWAGDLGAGLTELVNDIRNDYKAKGEPTPINLDESGTYLGRINYVPYISCAN